MNIGRKIKLKENERIVKEIRRYGLTYFWSWLLILLLLATPFFFIFWLFRHGWWGQLLFAAPVFMALWILLRTLFFWRRNVLVITTRRIVDFDQRGFLDKTISHIAYDQIEDVLGRIKGLGGTIFRYGNLEIQTGAGQIKIVVERVKKPQHLQAEIMEWRERFIYRADRFEKLRKE